NGKRMRGDDLSFQVSCREERRKLICPAQRFARRFCPMILKCCLQFTHEGASDARLDIPPMFFVLAVTGPVFGETDGTGKSQPTVNHQHAAMSPSIGTIDPPGLRRMIISKLTAGLFHLSHVGVVETPT